MDLELGYVNNDRQRLFLTNSFVKMILESELTLFNVNV